MNHFGRITTDTVDPYLRPLPDLNRDDIYRSVDATLMLAVARARETFWRIPPMAGISLTFPIVAGKVEAGGAFARS